MLFIIILSSIKDTSVEPGNDTMLRSAGKTGKTPRTSSVPRPTHQHSAGGCSGLVAELPSLHLLSAGTEPGHCHGHIPFLGWIFQMQVGHCWNGLGCSLAASEVGAEDLATHTQAHALEISFSGLKSELSSVPNTEHHVALFAL